MTIQHPIRRALARVCSAETMALIVDPILADVRWERRARWLGYLALARALALHSVVSTPRVAHRAWREDGFAIPRMAMWTVAAAIIFALLLVSPAFQGPEVWPALLLIPQAVAWTLPAVLLFAIPIALGGQTPNGRLTRRTMALAVLVVAATFALIVWIAPAANESYRQTIASMLNAPGSAGAANGPVIEMTEEFPRWSATPPSRRRLYEFQSLLALGSAALPLALLGLGLSTLAVARRRPWLFGSLAAIAYVFVAFPLEMWTSALLLRASSVPPFVLAWSPKLMVFVAGLALLARRTGPALSEQR